MSLMNNIISSILSQRKYDFMTEFCHKCFEDEKRSIFMTEYAGEDIRVYIDKNDDIHMMMPSVYNESAVTEFIGSERVYSFAQELANKAQYIVETCMPCKAMLNKHQHKPKCLQVIVTLNLGKCDKNMNPCCKDIDETEVGNFCNMKDALVNAYNDIEDKNQYYKDMNTIIKDHSGMSREDMDKELRENMFNLKDDIAKLADIEPEDSLEDDDVYADEEIEDVDEDVKLEFFAKRPKKLKPIPADLIPYITVEMNDIKDANDAAMLVGYTSSYIEKIDFYITCIDTNDARYIVPHTRQFLVNINKQLNDLLTRILQIKPINRNATMWKVNLPTA